MLGVVFVDVDDEQPAVTVLARGDTDAMIPIETGKPVNDRLSVHGGMVLPFGDTRMFLAWFDGDDMETVIGQFEGFGEDVGCGDRVKIQGCCLCLELKCELIFVFNYFLYGLHFFVEF